MGKGKKGGATQKSTSITQLRLQKMRDTEELKQCEAQYTKLFAILNMNQSRSGTAGFIAQAEKGIALAQRMMVLSRVAFAHDAVELGRLSAVYLSKQAKLLMFLGRTEESVVLFKQSFESSPNIVTSYEAYNGLVQSAYFYDAILHEAANYLIELYRRGLSVNVTVAQKDAAVSHFKIYQNSPEYQGQYKDVLNSFFYSAMKLYTEKGMLDEVLKGFNDHPEQIGSQDFDKYLYDLFNEEQFTGLGQLFSKLELTADQCDKYFSYVLLVMQKGIKTVDVLTHFSQCNHILSMAVLSWELIKYNDDPATASQAMDLAKKALSKSRAFKDATEQQNVAATAYQTIARIYDFGLLGDAPGYQQSDEKAFHYYKLSADAGGANSLQDMAIMYREGQGVPQDLNKAQELLDRSIQEQNIEAIAQLPGLFVMRASADPANRDRLLDEGISRALEGMTLLQQSGMESVLPDSCYLYQGLAILYLMKDSKISMIMNDDFITSHMSLSDLLNKEYFSDNSTANRDNALHYFTEAVNKGSVSCNDIIAIGFLTGNYLVRDLARAEYHIQQLPVNLNRFLLNILLELEHANDLEDGPEKEAHLQSAYTYYGIIEQIYLMIGAVEEVTLVRELIDGLKQNNGENQVHSLVSLFQRSVGVLPAANGKMELALLIDGALLELSRPESPNHDDTVLNAVRQIHSQLLRMRMFVPSFKELLPKLMLLQEGVSKMKLSNGDKYILIGYFQRWPIQNREALVRLNFTSRTRYLNSQQEIAHALLDVSHGCTVGFINNLRLVLLKKLDISAINDPHLLSQLLYCSATQVAAGYEGSERFVELARVILKVLNRSVDELYEIDKSQIYVAMQYFKLIDTTLLSELSSVQSLLDDQQLVISQENQVTISKQQAGLYEAIKVRFPTVVNEPVIAGRRPDYFIPEKNLVIFYNGPGHYHFDVDGCIVGTNLSTKLAEQTILQAGYAVEVISFEEYKSAKSLDKLVKERLAAYLPQRVELAENQNAWFNKSPKTTASEPTFAPSLN